MKKYDETANAVFDKSRKIKYRRKKAAGATAISAVTMCLALTLCVGAGYTITNRSDAPTTPAAVDTTAAVPVVSAPPITVTTETAETDLEHAAISDYVYAPYPDNPAVIRRCGPEIDISKVLWSGSGSMANLVELHYFNWQGKMVYEPLHQLLENGYTRIGGIIGGIKTEKDCEEPVYAIIGQINEFPFTETGDMECDYTYKGQTINEYKAEYHKYWELISDPQTRDENMSYFNVAEAAYNEAEQYFVQQSIDFQQKTLLFVQDFCTQQGISSEIIKRSDEEYPVFVCDGCGYYIIIYATASQFGELDIASRGLGNDYHMIFSWSTQRNRRGFLNGMVEL